MEVNSFILMDILVHFELNTKTSLLFKKYKKENQLFRKVFRENYSKFLWPLKLQMERHENDHYILLIKPGFGSHFPKCLIEN